MNKKMFYIILIIFFLIGIFFLYQKQISNENVINKTIYKESNKKSICGNGICEKNENCAICMKDCKCDNGEYCDFDKGVCVSPICGNGKCEIMEDYTTCCIDCPCPLDSLICNSTSKKCETRPFPLSEEEIISLIKNYFKEKGISIRDEDIFNIEGRFYKNVYGMGVSVQLNNTSFSWLFVYENGTIISLPHY